MKTNFKLLAVVLCATKVTTAVFGQTTYIWTGAADGTNFEVAANWSPPGSPVYDIGATAEFNGVEPGNLLICYGGIGTFDSPPGWWINICLTSNQVGSVTIDNFSANLNPQYFPVFNITIDSGAGAFSLGGNTQRLNYLARPSGAVHSFTNNSTNTATFGNQIRWAAGGGADYTMDFSGTGNWQCNSYLVNDNGAGMFVQVDGPGTMFWNPAGFLGANGIRSPVVINGGALVLQGSHPRLGSQAITNNGTFEFDAPSQSQMFSGVISGTGLLTVSSGTLTLLGQNIYTGNTVLSGGEMIVNGAENPGVSGPLGVGGTISFTGGTLGYSVSNAFDYSSRFSTAAGQAYSFDTRGQNVTFATGLGSSGGMLCKSGDGTLTLAGSSTYSGATAVNAGKLLFQGSKSGSGSITVANGAALGVVENGAQVAPITLTVGTNSGANLEFNNVTNPSTAPIAAGTISSAGAITININSGSFAVGQSYPLFSWSAGSAPAVSMGTVAGAVGNLSTNGNTIQFNVTSVTPPTLNFTQPSGNNIQFTWTGSFKLQAQTNSLNAGLGTNWSDYPGGGTSPVTVPIGMTNGAVFFRLLSTP
jgi:autotransporter-associated beta strand protein